MVNFNKPGEFVLEPVEKLFPHHCPVCFNLFKCYNFCDAETIYHGVSKSIDYSRFLAIYTNGNCPHCNVALHTIEISIASNPRLPYSLENCHTHEYKKETSYWIYYKSRAWNIIHYEGITKMGYFLPIDERKNPNSSYYKSNEVNLFCDLEWLDYHILPYFYIKNETEGKIAEYGASVVNRLVPVLLSANFWTDELRNA